MPIISTGKPCLLRWGKSFALLDDYVYIDSDNTTWLVPKGFTTDLASIPRWIFWWQFKCVNWAAILHDYGYKNHQLIRLVDGKHKKIRVNRKICDRLFYEACIELGISRIESKLFYWAVHLFGRFLW